MLILIAVSHQRTPTRDRYLNRVQALQLSQKGYLNYFFLGGKDLQTTLMYQIFFFSSSDTSFWLNVTMVSSLFHFFSKGKNPPLPQL